MKEKKTIIILILVLFIGIIGLTVAYFANSTSLDNIFLTKPYGTTVEETFTSPSNWLPGDEITKEITATNTGEVDQAVRIKLTEEWIPNNSNSTLNGWIHADGTKSTHTSNEDLENDQRVAVINFDNLSDWTKVGDYYYYKYKLSPNESTSSLIKSVTFNPNTKLDDTCVSTQTATGQTITCNSSGSDYDHATYTLTFDIETVQYNKYNEAWNTDVSILEEKPLTSFTSYHIGDEITYDNDIYYVIQDSDSSSNYVVALKEDFLTADEVNNYGNYVSEEGEYPYYRSSTCYYDELLEESVLSGCTTNYNQSDIKTIVDGWSNVFGDDLIEIDGYKSRLLNLDEIYNLGFVLETTPSSIKYNSSDATPDWYDKSDVFWTMIQEEDSNYSVFVSNENWIVTNSVYNSYRIRPVINLKKSAIGTVTIHSNIRNFNIGETVMYNHTSYCVLENSDENKDYITLIKSYPLTYNEVINNKGNLSNDYFQNSNNIGLSTFYTSSTCTGDNNKTGCIYDYDSSFVKTVVDNWSASFINNLKEIDGYKARIIYNTELTGIGYENQPSGSSYVFRASEDTPDCFETQSGYWGMNDSYRGFVVNSSSSAVYNKYEIRPVINLKKCALTNSCE